MLRCDSVAPLGKPVVPDVYWMLIGSSDASDASRAARSSSLDACARRRGTRPSRRSSTIVSRSSGQLAAHLARASLR